MRTSHENDIITWHMNFYQISQAKYTLTPSSIKRSLPKKKVNKKSLMRIQVVCPCLTAHKVD